MHATAFLKSPQQHADASVFAVVGGDRFLQQSVLKSLRDVVLDGDDFGLSEFDGRTAEYKSVMDELRTVSMWGERRLIVVDAAEDFISEHRARLEKSVVESASKSVLALVAKSLPKNTRLYKAIDKHGVVVDCESLKEAALGTWLTEQARGEFDKKLPRDAARLMVELVGENLGRLSQELEKLVNYVGDRGDITIEDVVKLVGGWKAETTWAMNDHILAGRTGAALECLEKLLAAREFPLQILGGMNFKFRQLLLATDASRGGQRLGAALADAGVWRNAMKDSENYLRRIGRPHAERLGQLLITARDQLQGGGGSLTREQERIVLERLIVDLTGRS